MAQQNNTRFAILGILAIQPASGYRIKQFCDVGIAHFWNENYGHLYPMLRQMAQAGEIEPEEGSGSGRRSQRYWITEQGRAVLQEWLDRPPESAPARLELLLKLTFSMHGSPGQALRLVRDSRIRHERRLAELEQKERELLADDDARTHPAFEYGYCTLRYGILDARFRLTWCDETIARLSNSTGEVE